MFTLEIAGRPIAVTDADQAQAQELFVSQEFQSDLRSLQSERRPLWDGSAVLNTRPASEDEIDAFEAAFSADDEADEDGINVMFLLPLDTTDTDPGAKT